MKLFIPVFAIAVLASSVIAYPSGYGVHENGDEGSEGHNGLTYTIYSDSGKDGGHGYSDYGQENEEHSLGSHDEGQTSSGGDDNGHYDHHADYFHYPKYEVDYGVHDSHTGDYKKAWESRDGDVVKGGYTFTEADGSIRLVTYTADHKNGFNAVVKHLGKPNTSQGH